ncbi:MAG: DUF554 domain-containing protein [Anaerolineales bacterium]|jgi:uncharacterized membrane protein YqgA involved in biofilm formation
MTGTFINTAAILLGGALGTVFGKALKERSRQTIVIGLGLFTLALAVTMFLESNNALIVLGGVLLGGLIGEYFQIEDRINRLGERLESRFSNGSGGDFVRGFLTSSVLFCTGPMAILGAIQDGLTGDYQLLVIKSVMDGFAAFALASTLGVGVLFSAVMVLLYQGFFSLLAVQLQSVMTPEMIAELTATGGILLIGLAISSLLEIKTIRVGNFLPGLAISPLIVLLISLFPH